MNPGELLCHAARSLRFYGDGLVLGPSQANHLAWPILWLTVLPGGVYISQPKWIPARRTLGGWSSPPSFGPSQILQVSFQQQHLVPYWDLLLLDSSGKWAWPRWVILVSSSLTVQGQGGQSWLLWGLFPWLIDGHLPVSSYGLPSVTICVQISSYKDHSHIGLEPRSCFHFNLITILKVLSPNAEVLGVKILTYEFRGDTIQLIIYTLRQIT